MRENQTVFPHRCVGSADAPAPIPGMGLSELVSPGNARRRLEGEKVAAEGTSAAPATLALVR
jgi:hypothetical protein